MKRSLHAALPSIDSLIVFEQAAQYLSFTRAGEHLGLTQSAVSRQMIDLEALLQVKLFAREKQRLKLTNAGAEFRELTRPVIRDLRAATMRMQMRSVQSNVLNISVAASFCNLWFIPNLPGFYAEHGHAQVNVLPHIGKVDFGSAAVDAAIVNAEAPPENCGFVKLGGIEVAPYASAGLLERIGVASLGEFERIPAVELIEGSGLWQRYLGLAGLPEIAIDYVGSQSLLLLNYEAAVAGLGVALLPPEFVAASGGRAALVRLHETLLQIGRSYYFCWPHASRKPEAVQALGAWLQREVEASRLRGSRTRQA